MTLFDAQLMVPTGVALRVSSLSGSRVQSGVQVKVSLYVEEYLPCILALIPGRSPSESLADSLVSYTCRTARVGARLSPPKVPGDLHTSYSLLNCA